MDFELSAFSSTFDSFVRLHTDWHWVDRTSGPKNNQLMSPDYTSAGSAKHKANICIGLWWTLK